VAESGGGVHAAPPPIRCGAALETLAPGLCGLLRLIQISTAKSLDATHLKKGGFQRLPAAQLSIVVAFKCARIPRVGIRTAHPSAHLLRALRSRQYACLNLLPLHLNIVAVSSFNSKGTKFLCRWRMGSHNRRPVPVSCWNHRTL
jgi:hypothetical protein